MKCHVYRSSVREGLYVYVAAGEDGATAESPGTDRAPNEPGGPDATATDPPELAALPAPVRRQLGRAELAMTLELDRHRRLGQENVDEVLENLARQGFHVQMPRDIESQVERVAREAGTSRTGRRDA